MLLFDLTKKSLLNYESCSIALDIYIAISYIIRLNHKKDDIGFIVSSEATHYHFVYSGSIGFNGVSLNNGKCKN